MSQTTRVRVPFPAFTGERVHMREFTKAAGLPADLLRWQDTVDAMLDGVDAPGPIFIMIDQGSLPAGAAHRRGGVHVDGYWRPALQAHGHGGTPAEDEPDPDGARESPAPSRPPARPGIGAMRLDRSAETLILASDVLGCAAYLGEAEGQPRAGGDCSHIDLSGLQRVELEPGRAWAGHTLTMLHESVPVRRDCLRTVVRLNVAGWLPS